MADELPTICNQCGEALGPKSEEVYKEGANEPDNPHFKVQEREDGEARLQCMDTGRLASPIPPEHEDYAEVFRENREEVPEQLQEDSESGEDNSSQKQEQTQQTRQQTRKQQRQGDEVFDFDEDKDQMDLLAEVVSNPHYGLSDDQVREIRAWAEDYNGQMPPDALESLVGNMSGVQKQTAELIRRRYELKLNNWFRQQQQDDSRGPPIGAMGGGPSMQRGRTPSPRRPTPTPNRQNRTQEQKGDEDDEEPSEIQDTEEENSRSVGGLPNQDLREERRNRRVKRRNDALDITAEEMAKQAAPEIARELSKNFGTYFGLPAKILEAKAERDPDWFLEKADEIEDKLGITMMDILEDSEAKKERDGNKRREPVESNPNQTEVDDEMDQALEQARGNLKPDNPIEEDVMDNQEERVNRDTGEPQDATPMSATPELDETPTAEEQEATTDGGDENELMDADKMYEETFGGEE